MKDFTKYIVPAVIVALTVIFAYQSYWLMGVYSTLRSQLDADIREAVRYADYAEMVHRVHTISNHPGMKGKKMQVSVGARPGNDTFVQTKADRQPLTDSNSTQTDIPHHRVDEVLSSRDKVMEMGLYFQRGMHAGLDNMLPTEPLVFDSVLTAQLDSLGIDAPHTVLYLQDKGRMGKDTLSVIGKKNAGYTDTIRLGLNMIKGTEYVVLLKNTHGVLWKQMAGILAASLIILVILLLVFWFLIHTIHQQKTLDEMKTDFTNNMTHELKTPIAVSYAANEALLNFDASQDKDKLKKYLTISQEQLKKLAGLVEQILSISMERRKNMKLVMEDCELRAIIDHLVNLHKMKAPKLVTFTLLIEDRITVRADRQHLSNVVSNLIDNAIKYSGDKVDIHIKAYHEAKGKVIEVTDNGMGIDKEKLPLIFDKFYRVSHKNHHNVKGYGLGLFYVKSMMEKFGGWVSVESTPGKGSTFKLFFYE